MQIVPRGCDLLQVGLIVGSGARLLTAGALPSQVQPLLDAGVHGPARLGQPALPRVTADQLHHLSGHRRGVGAGRGRRRVCARVRSGGEARAALGILRFRDARLQDPAGRQRTLLSKA